MFEIALNSAKKRGRLLDYTFSGIQFTYNLSFLREVLHSKMYAKIACNLFSGHYGVPLLDIQPFSKL